MVVLLAQEGGGEQETHPNKNLSAPPPNTTQLWRAVEPSELADVEHLEDYGIHPNSAFKRFAFSEEDLDAFIKAQPTRKYMKTHIEIPNDKLELMYRHADPGGVGDAIGIDVYEHPEFYTWFNKIHIVR